MFSATFVTKRFLDIFVRTALARRPNLFTP
jgi:hypothetical protein